MPTDYNKIQLGQLISAIWSKYLSLQGGDVETQRQLLAKEKEIFQKEKEVSELKLKLNEMKLKDPGSGKIESFEKYVDSGKLSSFIAARQRILTQNGYDPNVVPGSDVARAFGLVEEDGNYLKISQKGREFFEWLLLNE